MGLFGLGKKNGADKRVGERRQGGEHDGPERRSGTDQRGLAYGLKFKTVHPLAPLEDWLENTFPGEYRLIIEEISEDLAVKTVRAVFATDAQRVTFKAELSDYLKGPPAT